MITRKSTLSFSRKHAGHIPTIAEALELPMVPDILDTIDRNRGARIVILAPTQKFKTLIGQLRWARNSIVDPPMGSGALWYNTPEKSLQNFAVEKINPLIDRLPVLHPHMFYRSTGELDNTKKTTMRLHMSGHHLFLLSASTDADRHGKTARDIYYDEPHLFKAGWLEQISRRRSSFDEAETWQELGMSTGSVRGREAEGGEFTAIWDSSDRRTWHVRCPGCKRYHRPRFAIQDEKTGERIGGLVYETHLTDEGLPDDAKIVPTIRYRCPRCGFELPDTTASRLALSGTAERPLGIFVLENPNPAIAPPTIGMHVHGIAVSPWAPMVIKMIKAQSARKRGDLSILQNLIMLSFAEIWDVSDHFKEGKQRPVTTPPYRMGEEWAEEAKDEEGRPWRFAGIDVQQDHFVLTIRKWANDSRSRLHWAEKITTAGRLIDTLEKMNVHAFRVFLDARHESQKVRRLCQMNGWRCVLGEGDKDYLHKEMGVRRIYSEPKYMDAWSGTERQGYGTVAEFNFSKTSALDRWHLLRNIESNSGELTWSCAEDAPDWYFKEIEAFHRIRKEADGVPYYQWTAHGPDHAADAETIGVVAASMAGLIGIESINPPSDEKKPEEQAG